MDDSPYAELPGGSGSPLPPAPGTISSAFDIDRGLRHGFAALKRAPWVLLAGGFFKSCTEGGGGVNLPDMGDMDAVRDLIDKAEVRGHGALPLDPTQWFAGDGLPFGGVDALLGLGIGLLVALVVVALVLALVMVLASAWLGAGWIRLHEEIIKTGEGRAGTLFTGGDVFASMLGWTILSGLIGLAGIVLAILPLGGLLVLPEGSNLEIVVVAGAAIWALLALGGLLYLRLSLCLVPHIITLERQPVMAAVERSFALTAGGRGHLLLYMALFSFIGFLATLPGYCLCVVGVLVTRPLGVALRDLPYTEGFLHLTQPPDVVAAYSISTWGDD
jgi:hypothetical protein